MRETVGDEMMEAEVRVMRRRATAKECRQVLEAERGKCFG